MPSRSMTDWSESIHSRVSTASMSVIVGLAAMVFSPDEGAQTNGQAGTRKCGRTASRTAFGRRGVVESRCQSISASAPQAALSTCGQGEFRANLPFCASKRERPAVGRQRNDAVLRYRGLMRVYVGSESTLERGRPAVAVEGRMPSLPETSGNPLSEDVNARPLSCRSYASRSYSRWLIADSIHRRRGSRAARTHAGGMMGHGRERGLGTEIPTSCPGLRTS